MDRSDKIKQQVKWVSAGQLSDLQKFLAQDGVLDVMAQAHDAEESAQKGEPDPWRTDLVADHIEQNGQAAHDEWVAERRAAMLCALKSVGLA